MPLAIPLLFLFCFFPLFLSLSRLSADKQHGFNLDLSYIGDRIIAMGFPSEGKEAAYRNPMSEVVRFLDTFHKDHYKVYNLCSERSYDPACFYGRVARYPFDDHNCPPMSLIYDCCRDIEEWMQEDPKNIAAIHCKVATPLFDREKTLLIIFR